jgi:hypothetical protein
LKEITREEGDRGRDDDDKDECYGDTVGLDDCECAVFVCEVFGDVCWVDAIVACRSAEANGDHVVTTWIGRWIVNRWF